MDHILWTIWYELGPYDIVPDEKGDKDSLDKCDSFEKIKISRSNIFSYWVVFGWTETNEIYLNRIQTQKPVPEDWKSKRLIILEEIWLVMEVDALNGTLLENESRVSSVLIIM